MSVALMALAAGGVALFLMNNKKNSSGTSENYFNEGGFVPGTKPSKVDKAFNVANQSITTGASIAAIVKKAAEDFKRNPNAENKRKLANAQNAAKKAAAQIDKTANKQAKKATQKANKATKSVAANAAKAAKKQAKENNEPTPKEREILNAAKTVLDKLGVVRNDAAAINEIKRITSAKRSVILQELKAKGVSQKELATLIQAEKVIKKYKK